MSIYSAVERLQKAHDRTAFDCGEAALNTWLREQANQASRNDFSRTFVVCKPSPIVVGFFTTVAGEVEQEAVPKLLTKGSGSRPVPVAILARLGVDLQEQNKGLGAALVKEATKKILTASDNVGIKAMVVHAKDENVANWYQRFGFRPSPTDPLHLFVSLKELRAAFE